MSFSVVKGAVEVIGTDKEELVPAVLESDVPDSKCCDW